MLCRAPVESKRRSNAGAFVLLGIAMKSDGSKKHDGSKNDLVGRSAERIAYEGKDDTKSEHGADAAMHSTAPVMLAPKLMRHAVFAEW